MMTSSGRVTADISGNVSIAYDGNIASAQRTDTTATSVTDSYTVPAGKVWRLKHGSFYRTQTGINGVTITVGGVECWSWLTTTSTVSCNDFDDILLDAGDIVKFYALTGTSGNITTTLVYEEYTA